MDDKYKPLPGTIADAMDAFMLNVLRALIALQEVWKQSSLNYANDVFQYMLKKGMPTRPLQYDAGLGELSARKNGELSLCDTIDRLVFFGLVRLTYGRDEHGWKVSEEGFEMVRAADRGEAPQLKRLHTHGERVTGWCDEKHEPICHKVMWLSCAAAYQLFCDAWNKAHYEVVMTEEEFDHQMGGKLFTVIQQTRTKVVGIYSTDYGYLLLEADRDKFLARLNDSASMRPRCVGAPEWY